MSTRIHVRYAGSALNFFLYIGAQQAFEELDVRFATSAGTSGGGIKAVGDGSGMTALDMEEVSYEMLPLYSKLIDRRRWPPWSVWTRAGLAKGTALEKILNEHVTRTFRDLQIPTAVFTANMTNMTATTWSTHTTPDASTAAAVVDGSRLPGLFEPKIIAGQKHRDGGLFYNYPIDFKFPDQDDTIPTIGLCFHITLGPPNPRAAKENLVEDLLSCLSPLMAASSRQHVSKADWARTIFLEPASGGLDFTKDQAKIKADITAGRESVLRWWDKNATILGL